MLIALQIIAILFALSMIYFASHSYKRKELAKFEIISWVALWTAAIFVTMFPDYLRSFARDVLLTRVLDLMVIGGFLLVISLVASAYVRTKKLEKKLEELVRKDAIKNSKK
jgi:hypothetical protein